jgi:hypothetical protein
MPLASGMVDSDDGYLVYPGYAIQLFINGFSDNTSYRSFIYYNNTNTKILYTLTSGSTKIFPTDYGLASNGSVSSQQILYQNNVAYGINATSAIRVWFRSTEILSAFSTSSCPDNISPTSTVVKLYNTS